MRRDDSKNKKKEEKEKKKKDTDSSTFKQLHHYQSINMANTNIQWASDVLVHPIAYLGGRAQHQQINIYEKKYCNASIKFGA